MMNYDAMAANFHWSTLDRQAATDVLQRQNFVRYRLYLSFSTCDQKWMKSFNKIDKKIRGKRHCSRKISHICERQTASHDFRPRSSIWFIYCVILACCYLAMSALSMSHQPRRRTQHYNLFLACVSPPET